MTFRDTTEIEKIRDAYHRCDEPGEVLIEKAYTAGLRRAQEMAGDTLRLVDCLACKGAGTVSTGPRMQDVDDCEMCGGRKRVLDLSAFNQAIDAEAGKGRT